MSEEQHDANTEQASSAAQDANKGATSSEAQVQGGTDTAQQGSVDNAEGTEKATEKTMADVAKEAFDKATAAQAEGRDREEEGLDNKVDKTEAEETTSEEQAAKSDEAETEEVAAEKKEESSAEHVDPDKDLPFHNHPRFKEIVHENQELKAQVPQLKTQLEQSKPIVEWAQKHNEFIAANNITPEEVTSVMNFLALSKQNPARAREALKPIWEKLAEFDVEALPQNYKNMVAEGECSEAVARRLWKAEVDERSGQVAGKFTAEQQARMATQAVNKAVADWDLSKRASDPDFKPSSNGEVGLWEVTASMFTKAWVEKPPQTAADAVKLQESAYAQAKKLFTKSLVAQKKPTDKQLNSSNAVSRQLPKEPQTTDDVVKQVAKRHGIVWSGRQRS